MHRVDELIIDAYECGFDLSDAKALEKAIWEAFAAAGLKTGDIHHSAGSDGLTFCLMLEQARLLLSTWPKLALIVVNVFLGSSKMDPHRCWKALETALKPGRVVFHSVSHRIEALNKQAA